MNQDSKSEMVEQKIFKTLDDLKWNDPDLENRKYAQIEQN